MRDFCPTGQKRSNLVTIAISLKNKKKMKFKKIPCIYILANKKDEVLYTGVTSNLQKRVYEHKNNLIDGFTKKYNVHKLVYFEIGESMEGAIQREKQIKAGSRKKKITLITKINPEWKDLSIDLNF